MASLNFFVIFSIFIMSYFTYINKHTAKEVHFLCFFQYNQLFLLANY